MCQQTKLVGHNTSYRNKILSEGYVQKTLQTLANNGTGNNKMRPLTGSSSQYFCRRPVVFCILAWLGGCSTAFDDRQLVSQTDFGIPFEATLVNVFIARSEFPESIYGEAFGAVAEHRTQNNGSFDEILPLSSVARVVGATFATDVERYLSALRCIYLIRPTDSNEVDSIRSQVTGEFGGDQLYQDLYAADLSADEIDEYEERIAAGADIPDFGQKTQSSTAGLVTLTQSCNMDYVIGDEMIVIRNSFGGAIFPITNPERKSIREIALGNQVE